MSKNELNEDLLTIPVYLNTKIVFDMLATIENGFTTVTNVQTTMGENKENGIGAEIGTENVFSFLNIGLTKSKNTSVNKEIVENEEKTHTPVSLFQQLKLNLEESKLIKSEDAELKVGDFVELKGVLRLNPIIDLLSNMKELFELSQINTNSKNNKNNKNNKQIETIINSLLDVLKGKGTVDVICKTHDKEIVLQSNTDYFLNKNIRQIMDGEFKILGKIIKICFDKDENINLLRNTSFSLIQQSIFDTLLNQANDDTEENVLGLNINKSDLSTKINSPTMLVIPIAIYV